MRYVGRILLAVAVVAGSVQISFAQSFRDAGSKVTGNYNGVYSTSRPNRTYRSYSYVAPRTTTVMSAAPAVTAAPKVATPATQVPNATAVAPAQKPAVVAAPQQAQTQIRTQRTYSNQPSNQTYYRGGYYGGGYRSMRSNSYDPAFRRADAKILGH